MLFIFFYLMLFHRPPLSFYGEMEKGDKVFLCFIVKIRLRFAVDGSKGLSVARFSGYINA